MKITLSCRPYQRYGAALISGLAALTLLLTVASASSAASPCTDRDIYLPDTKVFPATMCRQVGATSTVYYDIDGRLLNKSTTATVTVICPIVRDATLNAWHGAQVVVADRNPSSNVTCTAHSNQTDGLGWSYAPWNPLPAGFFSLDWWASQTMEFSPPANERDWGTYALVCTIPPRYSTGGRFYDSGIYSYRIHECSESTNPS